MGLDAAWLHVQFRRSRNEFRSALEDVIKEPHGEDEEPIAVQRSRLLQFFS